MNYTRVSGVSVRVGDLGIVSIDRYYGNLIRRYHWRASRVGEDSEFGWTFTLEAALDRVGYRARRWAFEQFLEDFELASTDPVSEHLDLLPIYSSTLQEVEVEMAAIRDTLGRKNKGENR